MQAGVESLKDLNCFYSVILFLQESHKNVENSERTHGESRDLLSLNPKNSTMDVDVVFLIIISILWLTEGFLPHGGAVKLKK